MNYLNHYNNLINKSIAAQTIIGCYENHHIVPRCMGGDDSENNLVKLTPEQHYVAHQLLYKIYKLPELLLACVMMTMKLPNRNNKSYGWVRRLHSESASKLLKDYHSKTRGYNSHEDFIEDIVNKCLVQGITYATIAENSEYSIQTIHYHLVKYIKENGLEEIYKKIKFKWRSKISKQVKSNFTPEQEAYRIEKCKSHDYSERDKEMSLKRMGSGNPMFGKTFSANTVVCPHCNKSGGVNVMKRWHFDKCKLKLIKE